MKTIEIKGKTGHSVIYVGERLNHASAYLPETEAVIITDENVAGLYQQDFPEAPVITIKTGEGIKTLETAADIYRQLIMLEADRSVFLLGIGGGIVCDITGFVASTYLRGVRFGYVPTTLLAQVDASVGGKTGVNFLGYKNMVGVFNQPEFVICDPVVLQTLTERELAGGFAEIVKHAAIADMNYFIFLESQANNALSLNFDVIEQVIYDSVKIKADIVNRDETEKGERRKLNFGHTVGHAVEKSTGMPHGEAVSIGMVVASALSASKGMLSENDADRIKNLLGLLNLPIQSGLETDTIVDAIYRDKKREGESLYFVLLSEIGKAVVKKIPITDIVSVIKNIRL